jgi:hypothetical protein
MALIPENIMKALLLVILVCFSCEDKGWFVRCSDCTKDEPVTARLNIDLDISSTLLTLKIYQGNIEDSILYHSEQITWTKYTIDVPPNKKYTATVTYFIDGKEYRAVDSATPRIRYTKDQCDEPCYYLYDNDLNLKLKYTAGN